MPSEEALAEARESVAPRERAPAATLLTRAKRHYSTVMSKKRYPMPLKVIVTIYMLVVSGTMLFLIWARNRFHELWKGYPHPDSWDLPKGEQ